jgi:competence protein ComEA
MKWLKKYWMDGVLGLGLLLLLVGLGLGVSSGGQNAGEEVRIETANEISQEKDIKSDSKVRIDMSGEVLKPGVYSLEAGARVEDGLLAAGGLGKEADRDWVEKNINKAKVLMDGEKIYIPKVGEVAVSVAKVLGTNDGLISLNSGDLADLDKLEGIGPALAGRIIAYREANGGFRDINELKLVSGIGDKLFERIKDKVGL